VGLIINEFDKVYGDHIQALNDPKLRKEYQDLCFDLHLPCPSAYWTSEVIHRGKVISHVRQPAGSWTRNFWNWMAMSQLSLNNNSPHLVAGGGISFLANSISDASSRFVTSGFESGMEIIITNTHFNDGYNIIDSVSDNLILTVSNCNTETAGAATIDRYFGNDDTLNWRATSGAIKGSTTDIIEIGTGALFTFETQGGYGYRAGVTTNYGILVGTSNDAVSLDDYFIAVIPHGTGADQLSYQGMAIPSVTWTQGSLTMNVNWNRYMNNNSGGDITVEEVGLAAYTEQGYILFERHVTGGLLVPATAQLQYDYNMSMVYST